VIEAVVSPVDQVFAVGDEEVNTTLPPSQKVVEPLAVITGSGTAG